MYVNNLPYMECPYKEALLKSYNGPIKKKKLRGYK
jgi:hypothetical protein